MKQSSKRRIILAIKKNLPWLILLICIIVFLAIIEDILENEIWRFDDSIYQAISSLISNPVTKIAIFITNLGGAIGVLIATVVVCICLKQKKYKLCIVFNLVTITILNQMTKWIVQRPRPMEHRIINQFGYSFPSGHSMVSMAFYGFFIFLIYKNMENKLLKWSLCTGLSFLILLIGVSRIYLGVHYTSDVIGGFCLSIAYLIVYTKMIEKI